MLSVACCQHVAAAVWQPASAAGARLEPRLCVLPVLPAPIMCRPVLPPVPQSHIFMIFGACGLLVQTLLLRTLLK